MFLSNTRKKYMIAASLIILVIALSLLIAGILLNQKSSVKSEQKESTKYIDFLTKVKTEYYKHFPQHIYLDPDVIINQIIDNFNPLDPTPGAIKIRTDSSKKLINELKELKIDGNQLSLRERKSFAQLEHFLRSNFGHPYDENYYAGDWMLGPNYFCWQEICNIGHLLGAHFNTKNGFQPKTFKDVEKLLNTIKQTKVTFEQYQTNIYTGVKAGMVRSVEECSAGLNSFKNNFKKIAFEGVEGVLNESFAKDLISDIYYDKLSVNDKEKFKTKYNDNVSKKVSETLIEYVGRPLYNLIIYLKTNHSRHCVPSNVASGLGNLPLDKIWLDQTETRFQTTKTLPTGELLNGAKSYEMILPYFTTSTEYTYDKIYKVGLKQVNVLYDRAKILAKQISNISNETLAIHSFSKMLDDHSMFFNTSVIPDNENGEEGGRRCPNMAMAEKNCKVRYAAMQDWFAEVRKVLALIEPKTTNLFYFVGDKRTTPSCPVQMAAKFNPSSGSQSYRGSDSKCSRPSNYYLPFFLNRPGPKYNLFSVAGHESRPGHHTQNQGFRENFLRNSESNDVIDWLNANTYYTAFSEGWALYSENPLLAQQTDLYENNRLQEYGMLKWQLWRALRLIIDTGLHSRGMTMDEALKLFKDYAWDSTDKSYKDTIRYMGSPGQATAYMIGQLAIWKMRNKTIEKLKEANMKFDEKEFHFHILSQGSSPLQYLESYIDIYISCKINPTSRTDCGEVLNPNLNDIQKSKSIGTKDRWHIILDHHTSHLNYD